MTAAELPEGVKIVTPTILSYEKVEKDDSAGGDSAGGDAAAQQLAQQPPPPPPSDRTGEEEAEEAGPGKGAEAEAAAPATASVVPDAAISGDLPDPSLGPILSPSGLVEPNSPGPENDVGGAEDVSDEAKTVAAAFA